ncbi:SRPBCC family protein [Actinoalloteichus hymeniacidonis]|uniref:Polyketide cyclase / dehydrase and lipid transport n=1 Tax=Actinoalloteichus hymeniacidonis TaxID=340345 RepID=A0AAC9HVY8_9PSEU|nr:SRPBCC family protein [Actinoalloteichus hymeniacidonis]AOS66006.1 Polyketide cyclase / dehydrase and lipid transport [Actinoalloteichus hymeniacidonis]MBB5905892.1 uncharacterized protein YndB with AHSA1/START domain [Actinoalloteichus hymeniacidonis]
MGDNSYDFHSHWLMPAPVAEVADTLFDPADLPRWWPSVYLDVQTLRRTEGGGIGSSYELFTTGWLPYTLRWQLHVESVGEYDCAFTATGDFVGRGVWTLTETADGQTEVDFSWRIKADKPLLRNSPSWLKPFFAANHDWAMRRGEESLRLELRRRAARREGHVVPAPPAATPTAAALAAGGLGALAVGLVGVGLVRHARRRR